MSVTIAAGPTALTENKTHRFCTCWKITRTDATILYFTDHDHAIVFGGQTYTPVGGFRASARRKQSGLAQQNMEVVGILTSGAITHADLRGGRYREAEVWEYLVDWMYPWAGALMSSRYWIAELRFTGEEWEARVEGVSRWLRPPIGKLYSRSCWHTLGDTACTIDLELGAWKETGTVSDVTTAGFDKRRVFEMNDLAKASDLYNYGFITWTSGNNNGLIGEIKDWTLGTFKMELQEPMPYDLAVADTAVVRAGCDKLAATCKTKFSNLVNHGGFPFIPGNDRMLQTPVR